MKFFNSLILVGAFAAGAAVASPVSAATYKIDPDHSTVGFKIKHLAISKVPGRFTSFSGTFNYDPKNVAGSTAAANIEAKSIDTDQAKRDDHLRNADFFDVTKFPSISFKTEKIEAISDTEFNAIGQLTIRDVTKPVTLKVSFTGETKDPWGNQRAAFSATTKLNRKDFGLTWNKVLETGGLVVGEEVEVALEIEGIKQA